MDFSDNERLQELFLVLGDKFSAVKKIWWYSLLLSLVLAIPVYYVAKTEFAATFLHGYAGPNIIFQQPNNQPLQIIDKQIFQLGPNTYGGYIEIKNINLEWGAADQEYTAAFKTFGGTVLDNLDRSTFILPSSQKLIVLPSFTSTTKPDELDVSLGQTNFVIEPSVQVNFQVQRTTVQNNSSGLIVSAAFINNSPYILNEVDLPVAVYNNQNQIVAVNFTDINNVMPGETRTFQYVWPQSVSGAVRAEVNPEINLFDRTILSAPAGVSPFTNQ